MKRDGDWFDKLLVCLAWFLVLVSLIIMESCGLLNLENISVGSYVVYPGNDVEPAPQFDVPLGGFNIPTPLFRYTRTFY